MKKNRIWKIILSILTLILTVVFWILSPTGIIRTIKKETLSLNVFIKMINEDIPNIKDVHISENNIASINLKSESLQLSVVLPANNKAILNKLIDKNIMVYLNSSNKNMNIIYFSIMHVVSAVLQILSQIIYFKYLFGFETEEGEDKNNNVRRIKFKDIIGMQNEKEKLLDAYNYMINFDKYKSLGFNMQNGVILSGPPGNGKTYLARGLAGEVKSHFIGTTAASFINKYVGTGPAAVRKIYEEARLKGPSIVFIDEADALGSRTQGSDGGSSEKNATINQLLVELDGTNDNSKVLTILATNFSENLDRAILRSGRIGHSIEVRNPTITERKILFIETLKKFSLIHHIDIESWVALTARESRAYIVQLINDSCAYAIKEGIKKKISMSNVMLLPHHVAETFLEKEVGAKTEMIHSEKELTNTAYHEIGHAFLYYYFRDVLGRTMKFITIECRSRVLGFIMYTIDERNMIDLDVLRAKICVSLAGTLAEKIFQNRRTPGCSSDIESSRNLAELYVLGGMNDSYGLHSISKKKSPNGYDSLVSEQEKENIYNEVTKLINELTKVTYDILNDHKEIIEKFYIILREKLTITGNEIYKIFDGVSLCKEIIHIEYEPVIKMKEGKNESI